MLLVSASLSLHGSKTTSAFLDPFLHPLCASPVPSEVIFQKQKHDMVLALKKSDTAGHIYMNNTD